MLLGTKQTKYAQIWQKNIFLKSVKWNAQVLYEECEALVFLFSIYRLPKKIQKFEMIQKVASFFQFLDFESGGSVLSPSTFE